MARINTEEEYEKLLNELTDKKSDKNKFLFTTYSLPMKFCTSFAINAEDIKFWGKLKKLITDSGGLIKFTEKNEGMSYIRLVHHKTTDSNYKHDLFLSKFVLDCLKEEKLLDLRDYRATETKFPKLNPNEILQRTKTWEDAENLKKMKPEEVSDFSDEDNIEPVIARPKIRVPISNNIRRKFYTTEEERNILQYIIDHKYHYKVKGNDIWKLMEKEKVCSRTWQSMKERFLKHIILKIKHYKLPPAEEKKLMLFTSKEEEERGIQNSDKDLMFKYNIEEKVIAEHLQLIQKDSHHESDVLHNSKKIKIEMSDIEVTEEFFEDSIIKYEELLVDGSNLHEQDCEENEIPVQISTTLNLSFRYNSDDSDVAAINFPNEILRKTSLNHQCRFREWEINLLQNDRLAIKSEKETDDNALHIPNKEKLKAVLKVNNPVRKNEEVINSKSNLKDVVEKKEKPGTYTESNKEKPGTSTESNKEKPGTSTESNKEKPGTSTESNKEKPGTSTESNKEKPGTSTESSHQRRTDLIEESNNITDDGIQIIQIIETSPNIISKTQIKAEKSLDSFQPEKIHFNQNEESRMDKNCVASVSNSNCRDSDPELLSLLPSSNEIIGPSSSEVYSTADDNEEQHKSPSVIEGSSVESTIINRKVLARWENQRTALMTQPFEVATNKETITNVNEASVTSITATEHEGNSSNMSLVQKPEIRMNDERCTNSSVLTNNFNYSSMNLHEISNKEIEKPNIVPQTSKNLNIASKPEISSCIMTKDFKETDKHSGYLSSSSLDTVDFNYSDKKLKEAFYKNYSSSGSEESPVATSVKKKKFSKRPRIQDNSSEAEQISESCSEEDIDVSTSTASTIPKSSKYALKDDIAIIHYIYTNNSFNAVRGKAVWEDMERKQILRGRSWHSMKERFRKRIFPRIKAYRKLLDDKVIKAFLEFTPNGNTEGHFGKRKKLTVKYSHEEDENILKFIITNKRYKEVKGKLLWVNMSKLKVLKSRTWESLKNRFLTSIASNLDQFDLTPKQKQKFYKVLEGSGQTFRNKKLSIKYSGEEDYCILNFIISSRRYNEVKGKSLWLAMTKQEILKGRTWESLKNRFLQNIVPSLDKYKIDTNARICLESALEAKKLKKDAGRIPLRRRHSLKRRQSDEGSSTEEDSSVETDGSKIKPIWNEVHSSSDNSENSYYSDSSSTVVHPSMCQLPKRNDSNARRGAKKLYTADHRLGSLYSKTPVVDEVCPTGGFGRRERVAKKSRSECQSNNATNLDSKMELSKEKPPPPDQKSHPCREADSMECDSLNIELPTSSLPRQNIDKDSPSPYDGKISNEEITSSTQPEEEPRRTLPGTDDENETPILRKRSRSSRKGSNFLLPSDCHRSHSKYQERKLTEKKSTRSSTDLSIKLRKRKIKLKNR